MPAARLAEHVLSACWSRISAGQGAKGRRWYAWSRLLLSTAGVSDGWGRWLLARRSLTTGELAYYVCAGPAGLPLVALVRIAGARWRVEEAFRAGKGLCGLDQHQASRSTGSCSSTSCRSSALVSPGMRWCSPSRSMTPRRRCARSRPRAWCPRSRCVMSPGGQWHFMVRDPAGVGVDVVQPIDPDPAFLDQPAREQLAALNEA